MPSQNGSAAWHMLQRDSTMFSTSAKATGAVPRPGGRDAPHRAGRAALSHTTSAMPAAATAQVHQGLGLPAWRML